MGAQLSKGGVAAEGKAAAAADPAAAKANGQVSETGPRWAAVSGEPHGTQRPLAAWVPWRWEPSCCSFTLRTQIRSITTSPPPPLLTWMKFKISLNKAKTGSPASGGPPAEQPSSARARPRSARTTSLLLPFVNSSAAPTGGELAAHFFYTRRADCGRSVFLELVLCHELGPCSGD